MIKTKSESYEIVLVHVPYVLLEEPSVALGMLKAETLAAGYSCRVLYANMLFAETVGLDVYQMINHIYRIPAIGDWTFARAAFPDYNPDHRRFIEFMASNLFKKCDNSLRLDKTALDRLVEVFYKTREQTPEFARQTAEKILSFNPRIVGCSSTFEQHAAALAVLRAVREKAPDVITVIGGANCEDAMGACAARNYPWVDYVFSGEADEIFPEFCGLTKRYGKSIPAEKLHPAIFRRDTVDSIKGPEYPRAVCENLDALPIPDYHDYFAALKKFRYCKNVRPALLFETSRGCWWGIRNHCVFCGRNRHGNEYRVKSPKRILDEMEKLSTRHGIKTMGITDNMISQDHFKTVFPELARRGKPYSLYMETKANLNRAQVKLLADAGVNWFQPGIEALHDKILTAMNKGTSTHVNLQVLKYAREYGLRVCWNIIFANPGDHDEWYAEIMEWLPYVTHFPPPTSLVAVFFVRHSPYFQNPEKYGLRLAPFNCFSKVFPLTPDQLMDQAYYFQNSGTWRQSDFFEHEKFPSVQRLNDFIPKWRTAYHSEAPKILCMTDTPDGVDIFDTRPCAVERRCLLTGAEADICRLCDPAVLVDRLPELLKKRIGREYPEETVKTALAELRRRGIVIQLPNRMLFTVALTGDVPSTADPSLFPHGRTRAHNMKRILEHSHSADNEQIC